MEFRSRRVGDIPPALTSSLLPSFPFLEKPKTGEPPSPPAAQQLEETDSPQSPLPDEEGEVDIQPHQQKMLVQFPSRRGRRPVCGGLLARNPQVSSASLLTRRTIVSSLYPTTGQIPMVLVPPLGGRYPPHAGTESGGWTIRCATYEETSRRRRDCTPTDQSPPAKTTEAVLIATRNELYGKDYPPVQEVRPAFSGWTLT